MADCLQGWAAEGEGPGEQSFCLAFDLDWFPPGAIPERGPHDQRSLKPELVRRFGVREISLFGSFARGEETTAIYVYLFSKRALRPRHRDAIRPEVLVV